LRKVSRRGARPLLGEKEGDEPRKKKTPNDSQSDLRLRKRKGGKLAAEKIGLKEKHRTRTKRQGKFRKKNVPPREKGGDHAAGGAENKGGDQGALLGLRGKRRNWGIKNRAGRPSQYKSLARGGLRLEKNWEAKNLSTKTKSENRVGREISCPGGHNRGKNAKKNLFWAQDQTRSGEVNGNTSTLQKDCQAQKKEKDSIKGSATNGHRPRMLSGRRKAGIAKRCSPKSRKRGKAS